MWNRLPSAERINLFALICIQASNALIPLLIVPFALTMVGAAKYAQIAVTEALSIFALAVVLYSFDVDGVARVARLGSKPQSHELGTALSSITMARLFLFFLIAPTLLLLYWLVEGESIELLALWLLIPFGHIFHSYWLYQAIENNVPAAIITFLSRVLTLFLVVVFLRGPEDAILVPLAVGAPFALGGIISFLYLVTVLRIPLHPVTVSTVRSDLQHGKAIFAGNTAVTLYREMNVVILAMVGVSATGVAGYALAEKTIKMVQACSRPLNQFFFPKVLRALAHERAPNRTVARRIGNFTAVQALVVTGLIIFMPIGYYGASLVFPSLRFLTELPNIELMLAIMAPAMVLGVANFMFGTAGLNALQQRVYYFKAILVTAVVSVACCFAMGFMLGAVGAALSFLLAELLLLLLILNRYRGRDNRT